MSRLEGIDEIMNDVTENLGTGQEKQLTISLSNGETPRVADSGGGDAVLESA